MQALIVVAIFLIVAGLVSGLAGLTRLHRLQVVRIDVTGNRNVPESLVRGYAESVLYDGSLYLFSRTNIFLYPQHAIVRTIEDSVPRIATVAIERDPLFSQVVRIVVTERTEASRWCDTGGTCYLMDAGGFIYAEAASPSAPGEYAYWGGLDGNRSPIGQVFLSGRLHDTKELLDVLAQRGYAPLGARVEGERDYSIPLQGGAELRLAFGEDVSAVVKHLESVFAAGALKGRIADMEYVNLRYGNRVYYKLKHATSTDVE